VVGVVLGLCRNLCASFSKPSKHRKAPPTISSGVIGPGREGADGQRRRHQDGLVDQRALGHRPHHRQLAVGADAGDLLGVERQVVAQHAGGLLGGHLGQVATSSRTVAMSSSKGKQAGSGHGSDVEVVNG
jgi:hypothetical protein